MFIGEICNREVIVTGKDTTIPQIAKLMREYHVGSIIITEQQNDCRVPVGVVTDRDLVIELLSKDVDITSVSVGDIMTQDLATVRESSHVYDALKLMRGKGIRRIPVVNDEDVLIGIVTVDDLLDVVISQLDDIVNIIAIEQKQEKQLRQ
ncbi:MAG: CBS domain-containing protein [Gammaproteobacteria bacterium]|jgi:CBS domain-containing protein